MSKLKPCPFCGGEAELCYLPALGTDYCLGYTLYASCNECGAKSPGLWQEKTPNDQSWKDAADEWNSRPGEPDPENCGVACCEHYPEGLPVCSKCREESTLAHDKACALLAEARADIKDRDNAIAAIMAVLPDSAKPCDAPSLILHFKQQMGAYSGRCIQLEKQLAESRDEIDGLTLMATNASMEPARRLIQKNKELHAVIEQMREALRLALPEARSTHVEQTILAALAAERGE